MRAKQEDYISRSFFFNLVGWYDPKRYASIFLEANSKKTNTSKVHDHISHQTGKPENHRFSKVHVDGMEGSNGGINSKKMCSLKTIVVRKEQFICYVFLRESCFAKFFPDFS